MSSNSRLSFIAGIVAAVACSVAVAAPQPPPTPVRDSGVAAGVEFFEKRIRPVLTQQCVVCHGERLQQGGLRLDTAEGLAKGGVSGAALLPGKPEESLLIKAIQHSSGLKMPPEKKLPARAIADLTQWVREGAIWPKLQSPNPKEQTPKAGGAPAKERHWAFQPVRRPAVPVIRNPKSAIRNPIDAFVVARLQAAGLRMSPPADKRTLIRRATFDLTGLPPTPAEVEAFVADTTPGAFAKVVDRLLASPRYGEKWGRHWLDIARYADSNGLDENLHQAQAWRYRDWVIDAFNRDLPYNHFITEQLAGDLLAPSKDEDENNRRLVATGFLSLGAKMLAEDDPVKMEMDIIDEQVDTVGKAFMGMTLGCARCHDHKFDPVSMADYYALAGIFKSTKTMENFTVVAAWHENKLLPREDREKLARIEAQIAEKSRVANSLRQSALTTFLAAERRKSGEYLATALLLQGRKAVEPAAVLGTPEAEKQPHVKVVEAERYDRGNVNKDFTVYGNPIGVLVNAGSLPNFVEYDLDVPEAGTYQLETRLAAVESRPMRLSINGALVKSAAAAGTTGSWTPESQRWFAEGVFLLKSGKNLIRLERLDGPCPHIDKLAVFRKDLPTGAASLKTPEQLAAERGLNGEILKQWIAHLANVGEGSPLRPYLTPGEAAPGAAARFQAAVGAAEAGNPEQAALRTLLHASDGPFAAPPKPEPYFPPEVFARLVTLLREAKELEASKPANVAAMGVTEGKPTNLRIHLRGNHLTLGDEVPRRFLEVVSGKSQAPISEQRSGRMELAEWLTRPDHPLTGRVIVNRVWRWHFGRGLVNSPDNFGVLGESPTHPELLDWLAERFASPKSQVQSPRDDGDSERSRSSAIERAARTPNTQQLTPGLGWSLKALHRLIMLSATYQQAYSSSPAVVSGTIPKSAFRNPHSVDPENKLYWRFDRRRLNAEEIRDSIIAVAGNLDLTTGGSMLKLKNREYVTSTANRDDTDYNTPRRSVYLPVVRSSLYDVFQAFDFADPSTSNGERSSTTVAPQALFMMNSALVLKESRLMAEGLLKLPGDDAARVREAYLRCYGRPPSAAETTKANAFLARMDEALMRRDTDLGTRRTSAWQSLCRVLIAANEFLFLE